MDTVGAYEAKTHLSRLLDRVSKGERITITKHGVPVAVLQPPDMPRKRSVSEVVEDIRRFGERHTLDGLSVREMIEDGRD